MDLNVVSEDDDVFITTNTKDVMNIDEEIKHATNFVGVIEKITNYLQYIGDVDDVVASKTALNTLQHEGELLAPHNQKEDLLNIISQRQPFCYYSSLWKLYYQSHIKSTAKSSTANDHSREIAIASTMLVHSSSVFNDLCSMLLALPAEEQLAQRTNVIPFLYEQLPKVAANCNSSTFWSCFIQFLLLDNKELEASKMLILVFCLGVKGSESLCADRNVSTLFSVISTKLKQLRTQSPWSDLISQREKFNQSKTPLRIDCNKSVTDDLLWESLFELYKAELERISQEHTSQHVYRLYHAVLEHLDVQSKAQLLISESDWTQLGIDLLLFTLRKALVKFSKSRNKVNHLYYFAHQMFETLKLQSNKHSSSLLKFLAQFVQEHILHSSYNPNYYQDQPTWILLSSITHSMHGELFNSISRQEAIQKAKEICDLGAKQLSNVGIVPHLLINESAMLSLKVTGQPTTSREIFGAALEKYPNSIDLWLYYAQFERAIRQFKQAVSVYEKALSIKHVSNEPAVWRDYVQFSLQREKLGNARSIYIRSLSRVDSEFVDALWQDFLDFENNIRKKQSGDQPPSLLSLDQLKQAVIAQQPSLQTSQPAVIALSVIKQETAESLPSQVQTENAGHADHKREGIDVDNIPVKKPKIDTSSPGLPRLELPTSYTEQPVEALPAYVQPSAKFQRPAFRTPENRPSQHSDNLSIESPFVEALMQPVATITPEKEKPVFGAAPRTLASVSGTLTMEQIKLLEDAQKLLLQRQDSQPIPQSTNETPNVHAPTPIQPTAPTQQAPQLPQPGNVQQLPPLLIQLSEVLQDPLIFDIVKSLQNIQMLKDKEIQKGRHELKMYQKKMRDQLLQRHRELLNQATPITYQQIHSQNTQQLRLHEQSCRDELAQYDKKAGEDLERQILEQQRILQQAGVPGFFPSTNKADIELHSQLLKLILSLAQELEKDQNPTVNQQRLNTQQPPSIPETPTQPIPTIPLQVPPMTLQQASIPQPQLPQLSVQPIQQFPQLPPHIPIQTQIPQLPVQQPLPAMSQGPLDLLAALLAPSQPTQLTNVPMQPVHNAPQLSIQQITQMIGNLVSNTPAQSQGELIQQIQGYLPMLPNELQTHILQTLIATLQNQQNTVFQPMQHQDPNMLLANSMGVPLNFPPNDTIVLHGAQGPVTVPLSMLNQSLNFPQPAPNMNQPPPQQPRNPRQNYQKRRF